MMSLLTVCAVIVPGLSSKLCEEIRDILTVSVAPHQSAENPVQHYSTLLSLASLQRYVFVFFESKVAFVAQ
jgi:hypothetical protein